MITAQSIGSGSASVIGTFADINAAYDPTTCYGKKFIVTDFGYPIEFVSNGVVLVPVGGQATLALSGIGYGIMPSGTVSTGSSGHFVSGTALPHTYSEGLWMYFAATAGITPALTAGFYWCVFSNTTTCTIYTAGAGSAAYNFTVGSTTTGATTEITFNSVSCPANLPGTNGQFLWDTTYSQIGNTNTKTMRIKINTSNVLSYSNATAASLALSNNGVIVCSGTSAQYSKTGLGAILTQAITRAAENTTAAFTVSQTFQMAVATDYIICHNWRLDLYK